MPLLVINSKPFLPVKQDQHDGPTQPGPRAKSQLKSTQSTRMLMNLANLVVTETQIDKGGNIGKGVGQGRGHDAI